MVALGTILNKAKCIGFSGSSGSISGERLDALRYACSAVNEKCSVSTGVASGVETFIQCAFSNSVSSHSRLKLFNPISGDYGTGKSALFRCNEAKVLSVDNLSGIWISFPSISCPNGLKPSDKAYKCFYTNEYVWSAIAFALGLGLKTLLYLPEGLILPTNWKTRAKYIDKNWSFFPDSIFYKLNF